jgi:ParB family chromosome partitioning protein
VGPAPSAGRDRWILLATAYAERAVARPVDPLLESPEFLAAPSDARFEMLYEHLAKPDPKPEPARAAGQGARKPAKPRPWLARSGERVATVAVDEQAFVLTIDKAVARDFGEFLLARMGSLYEEYVAGPPKPTSFRHSIQR